MDPESRQSFAILERQRCESAAVGNGALYSYTDDEWENKNQRVWAMRNAAVAKPADELALDEYLCAVVGNQFFQMGFGLSPRRHVSKCRISFA